MATNGISARREGSTYPGGRYREWRATAGGATKLYGMTDAVEILVSGEAAERLGDGIRTSRRGSNELRGRQRIIEVFRLE